MKDSRICHLNDNNTMKKIPLFIIGIWFLSVSYLQAQENSPLHRIEKYGKWGYVDDKGNQVVSCKYNHAYPFYESELALVESEGQFGYINKQGQVKIPLQYKKAYPFSDSVAAVKKGGINKYGFINSKGEVIVKFDYSDVKWGFVEGYAWVKKGNSWGLINKSGVAEVDFQYSNISSFDPETGFADVVTKKGVIHYYDAKGNKFNYAKEREDANMPKKPKIEWQNVPVRTTEELYVLNAEIKSESEIEYYKVLLNGNEIGLVSKDLIALDHGITISKTLTLNEGTNTLKIKTENSGGEIIEERQIEYRPLQENAFIVWNQFPTVTNNPHVELDATIKSTFKNISFQIFQNGTELPRSKGSPDLGDNKLDDYLYSCEVKETFTLEYGKNTIKIVVKNAQGKEIETDCRDIKYTPRRIALVIGNEDYNILPLNQPVNDAEAIASRLDKLGFTVTYKHDLKKEQMITIANQFISDSRGSEVALLYFSGHGEQVGAISYLLPVDFDLKNDNCEDKGFPETYVLKSEAEMKIVIIDACRTMKTKGHIDDIEEMNQPNVFIAYSSAPNQNSYQGTGKYSIYTEALLKELGKANLKIDELFTNVADDVQETAKRMGKKQVPYNNNSLTKLTRVFVFNKQP